MSRLIHSEAGFIRSLEISGNNFFAFVEGGLDRPFTDRMLRRLIGNSPFRYQVISSKELPGDTGGKDRLLRLFKTLRSRKLLSWTHFGKRLVNAFFLDKDVDDVARKIIRSPHVIYTRAYDLEGHLFECGDLHSAIADACGLTRSQAEVLIGVQSKWVIEQAKNWADWIALCVIGQIKNVNIGCNFGRLSAINPDLLGPVDEPKLAQFKQQLADALGLSMADFQPLYDRYKQKVTAAKTVHDATRLFKGKWIKTILEKYISQNNTIPDVAHNGAGDKVMATLVSQVGLSLNCQCCSHFGPALQGLIAEAQKSR